MELKGSCHCGAVRFRLQSRHPYPFNLCYCSICRKTAGGGGYAINLSGDFRTLVVEGAEHVTVFHATIRDRKTGKLRPSRGERRFCRHCGSALWVYDAEWPELVHPFASAIDSELPVPPERTHLLLEFEGVVGSRPCGAARQAVSGVPGRIDRGVAPAAGAGAIAVPPLRPADAGACAPTARGSRKP